MKHTNTFRSEAWYQLVLGVLDGALRKCYLQDDEVSFDKATPLGTQFEAIESESNAMPFSSLNTHHVSVSEQNINKEVRYQKSNIKLVDMSCF